MSSGNEVLGRRMPNPHAHQSETPAIDYFEGSPDIFSRAAEKNAEVMVRIRNRTGQVETKKGSIIRSLSEQREVEAREKEVKKAAGRLRMIERLE